MYVRYDALYKNTQHFTHLTCGILGKPRPHYTLLHKNCFTLWLIITAAHTGIIIRQDFVQVLYSWYLFDDDDMARYDFGVLWCSKPSNLIWWNQIIISLHLHVLDKLMLSFSCSFIHACICVQVSHIIWEKSMLVKTKKEDTCDLPWYKMKFRSWI